MERFMGVYEMHSEECSEIKNNFRGLESLQFRRLKRGTIMRLTIGMRCRFKSMKAKEHSWSEYADHEALLIKRTSGGDFSVMVLREGKNIELKKKDSKTVVNQVAWVDEDDLDFVNANFDTNLDFIDWYQENEEDFCGDCGEWFPNNGGINPVTGEDYLCPNEDCPGRLFDSGICPCCKAPEPIGSDICPKCDFDWKLQC